ncbi:Chromosome partition protein Smc [Methyloligella halotolerans]|uniref:Chromosome partition protein Smc n=1 Tax=Methyloligella halotolerans TaxID=1177755 RepID=A0A1E2RYM7_9HYPH|nr:Chromosome partition protein Smc [Methyloligella halotolerans]
MGQGRVGEIVSAQPQERRRVLEDAAGIAGLHSRRHEAELRLKATEANLERLGDLIGQLTTQLNALKRQARQAKRYREVSDQLREREALHHHLMWANACTAVEKEEEDLQKALTTVGEETRIETDALRDQHLAAEKLQPLRDEEANKAAALHRLSVEREALDREEQRAQSRQAELETRLAQMTSDLAREQEQISEAEEMLRGLAEEERKLQEASADETEAPKLEAAAAEAAGALSKAEAALSEATEQFAQARAEQRRLESEKAELEGRISRLEAQASEIGQTLAAEEAKAGENNDLQTLEATAKDLREAVERLEEELSKAEETEEVARSKESDRRSDAAAARLRRQELETELATLTKLLKPAQDEEFEPLISNVSVAEGYEQALGTALGDDLDAASDETAPAFWRKLSAQDSDPALPSGAEPLGRFVTGADLLSRRLAQIGVVDSETGDRLQAELKPGQRLVTKDGDLWRWDGYRIRAGAATAAAARLQERNRLESLRGEAEKADATLTDAQQALESSTASLREAGEHTKSLRQKVKETQNELASTRDRIAQTERAMQERSRELGRLAEARTRTEESLAEARGRLSELSETSDISDKLASLEQAQQDAQQEASTARSAHSDAKAELESYARSIRIRQERIEAIAAENDLWQKRIAKARTQIETLQSREQEIRADLEGISNLPQEIEARRRTLLDSIAEAEKERSAAADALAEADTARREHDKALREVQERLSAARESKARSEARLEAARGKRSDIAHQIREAFDCAPEGCLKIAGLEPKATMPDISQVEAELHKLRGDRERLGAVNLRAEEEETEIAAQLEEIETEKADVEEAIASLRQGISNLNREGRKRLLEAFDTVDGHFKRLFGVLFGGGSAELQLVESDDPLQAGLEILACPPGKKPQVLTLLSGGEKALTALALVFAVFLTNPSPICVLDEVDAPLDDANVERFCRMMEEMVETTDTRFLIITHHPLTMARMNRLFGVTMAERGVSQLVSVNLETAEQLRDAV